MEPEPGAGIRIAISFLGRRLISLTGSINLFLEIIYKLSVTKTEAGTEEIFNLRAN